MEKYEKLSKSIPFYVTRPDQDGRTATWGISGYLGVLICMLVYANIVLWSIVGIIVGLGAL